MPDETRPDTDLAANERIVLRLVDGDQEGGTGDRWEVVGRISNPNKTVAMKAIAKDRPGKYRSVPLRSWQGGIEIVLPEKPKPESKPFE